MDVHVEGQPAELAPPLGDVLDPRLAALVVDRPLVCLGQLGHGRLVQLGAGLEVREARRVGLQAVHHHRGLDRLGREVYGHRKQVLPVEPVDRTEADLQILPVARLVVEAEGQRSEDAAGTPPLLVGLGPVAVGDPARGANEVVGHQPGERLDGTQVPLSLRRVFAADGRGQHAQGD